MRIDSVHRQFIGPCVVSCFLLETNVRTDKNANFQRDALKDGNMVLYLDIRANGHMRINITPLLLV